MFPRASFASLFFSSSFIRAPKPFLVVSHHHTTLCLEEIWQHHLSSSSKIDIKTIIFNTLFFWQLYFFLYITHHTESNFIIIKLSRPSLSVRFVVPSTHFHHPSLFSVRQHASPLKLTHREESEQAKRRKSFGFSLPPDTQCRAVAASSSSQWSSSLPFVMIILDSCEDDNHPIFLLQLSQFYFLHRCRRLAFICALLDHILTSSWLTNGSTTFAILNPIVWKLKVLSSSHSHPIFSTILVAHLSSVCAIALLGVVTVTATMMMRCDDLDVCTWISTNSQFTPRLLFVHTSPMLNSTRS